MVATSLSRAISHMANGSSHLPIATSSVAGSSLARPSASTPTSPSHMHRSGLVLLHTPCLVLFYVWSRAPPRHVSCSSTSYYYSVTATRSTHTALPRLVSCSSTSSLALFHVLSRALPRPVSCASTSCLVLFHVLYRALLRLVSCSSTSYLVLFHVQSRVL